MKLKVVRTPQTERDLRSIYKHIAQSSPESAERFFDAAIQTFEFLAAAPRIGRIVPVKRRNLKGLRKWSVAGFNNHLIFYLQRQRNLIIIRVLHGSRDLPRALRLSHSDQP